MFLLINIMQRTELLKTKKPKKHNNNLFQVKVFVLHSSQEKGLVQWCWCWRKSCLRRCKHSNLTTAQLKTLSSPWYSNQSDLMNLYILLLWHCCACKAPQMMFSLVSPTIQNTFNCLFTLLTSASQNESHAIQSTCCQGPSLFNSTFKHLLLWSLAATGIRCTALLPPSV